MPLIVLTAWAWSSQSAFCQDIQVITLTGTVAVEERLTYRLIPFELPQHTGAIEVTYSYSGEGNEIEIGLYDPNGFRGSSRSSKDSFYVGKYAATPSYFHGKLDAGEWNIMLSFPTIKVEAEYSISIRVIPEQSKEFTGPDTFKLSDSTRWYAGDFHTHTGHSDGFGCRDTRGKRAPCQVYQNVELAHTQGLDFVGIADHNTISHYQDIRTLQPSFPDLLILRGQEVTTFYGHANVYGSGDPVNFRIGYEAFDMAQLQEEVAHSGALLSINHPGRETGANCTGCGWSEPSTDYSKLEVIEVINETEVETPISGIPVWEDLLNQGYQIIGIGGSDDHSARSIGTPTTMVYASELSEKGLLDAVGRGKVYIRTKGNTSPEIEFHVSKESRSWEMGEIISLEDLQDKKITLNVEIRGEEISAIEVIYNGTLTSVSASEIEHSGALSIWEKTVVLDDTGWIRINLRDQTGDITVISNPIFIR